MRDTVQQLQNRAESGRDQTTITSDRDVLDDLCRCTLQEPASRMPSGMSR